MKALTPGIITNKNINPLSDQNLLSKTQDDYCHCESRFTKNDS